MTRLRLAWLLMAGCATHPVVLVAPGEAASGDCFQRCEALFGTRPTLNCGPGGPSELVCSYDAWPAGWSASPDDGCRAECGRAGLAGVEACRSATTRAGAPAVACQYRVGFH